MIKLSPREQADLQLEVYLRDVENMSLQEDGLKDSCNSMLATQQKKPRCLSIRNEKPNVGCSYNGNLLGTSTYTVHLHTCNKKKQDSNI